MISFDSISNIISLLDSIRDEINENYPKLSEKEWFQQLEDVLEYLDKVKLLMDF